MSNQNDWRVVYKKAILDDGTLLFPERLSKEFLERAKTVMGSYLYANQYQNEIIPEGEQIFKKEWLSYYNSLPAIYNTFIFIDPAISQADTSDYTGISCVRVDELQRWFVVYAKRLKVNPTELINLCFTLYDTFKPNIIGIEDVAFQRAIVHFAFEEMKRRGKQIPVSGIKRGTERTKEARILSLVPRFESNNLFLNRGLHDLELELSQFPRGAHDDILDSLSSIQDIVYYPTKQRRPNEPPHPNDPGYEAHYIQQLIKRQGRGESDG